jgi:pimeloyl-ACP methyl ester carboxylesterase
MTIEQATVTGAGVRLNVRMIHGQGSSSRVREEIMLGPLSEHYRLIAPDLRGHGRSEKPSRGYRASATWGEDLAAVARHFSADAPVLVG